MKILYLCSLFHPHQGGIETMVNELSDCFIKNNPGAEVVILTKKYPSSLPSQQKLGEKKIFRFPLVKNKNDFKKLEKFLIDNDKLLKSDIIHIVGLRHPLPLIGYNLAKRWGVGVMATVCGGEVPLKNDQESERVWAKGVSSVRPFISKLDYLTACSFFLKNICLEIKDINWGKIPVVYAGADIYKYEKIKAIKWPRPYILSLRRLVRSKGVDVLLKGFLIFSKKISDVDLLVIGDGPEEIKLKNFVKRYHLDKRVYFLGKLELGESLKYLKGAWCTVVPSRSEGGGLINLEALSVACPVIASEVGGIREYLGGSGLFFESENYRQLARKIFKLWTSPKLRASLTKKGGEFVHTMSWQALWPKYNKYYKNLWKKIS